MLPHGSAPVKTNGTHEISGIPSTQKLQLPTLLILLTAIKNAMITSQLAIFRLGSNPVIAA